MTREISNVSIVNAKAIMLEIVSRGNEIRKLKKDKSMKILTHKPLIELLS